MLTKTFPAAWKVAKVIHVFKGKCSWNGKNNYRPISVLLIVSKILEKHICEYLCNFLKENNLFHHLQFGFRKFHSTETHLFVWLTSCCLTSTMIKSVGLFL